MQEQINWRPEMISWSLLSKEDQNGILNPNEVILQWEVGENVFLYIQTLYWYKIKASGYFEIGTDELEEIKERYLEQSNKIRYLSQDRYEEERQKAEKIFINGINEHTVLPEYFEYFFQRKLAKIHANKILGDEINKRKNKS